jgi:hypothetical protein
MVLMEVCFMARDCWNVEVVRTVGAEIVPLPPLLICIKGSKVVGAGLRLSWHVLVLARVGW